MRQKALIIGAPPSQWTGPRINLRDGSEWLVKPEDDYRGLVAVRFKRRTGEVSERLLDGEEVSISGEWAQGVILPEIEGEDSIPYVSVNIECVRK